jgi:hypothetical protein
MQVDLAILVSFTNTRRILRVFSVRTARRNLMMRNIVLPKAEEWRVRAQGRKPKRIRLNSLPSLRLRAHPLLLPLLVLPLHTQVIYLASSWMGPLSKRWLLFYLPMAAQQIALIQELLLTFSRIVMSSGLTKSLSLKLVWWEQRIMEYSKRKLVETASYILPRRESRLEESM